MTRSILLGAFLMIIASSAYADKLTFEWDKPPLDERISGFELNYGKTSGEYTQTKDIAGADSVTTDVEVTETGVWYFALRSVNADKTLVSEFTNEVAVNIGEPLPVPGALKLKIQITVDTGG